MTIYILLSAALLLTVTSLYFFLRRQPHALVTLVYEKAGKIPSRSCKTKEWTTPVQFEKTLKKLLARGFTPVSFLEVADGKKLPQKPVLLAFIGGYKSFLTEIFPILQTYKTQASVFLPPALTGTFNAWQNPAQEPWQNLLTQDDLKTLQKSGLIHFGAMALHGEDLSALEPQEARFLAAESLFRLQKQLGLTPCGFAFWPAVNFDEKKAGEVLPGPEKLPIITPISGVNPLRGKTHFLKVLRPSANPLQTAYALFKHR